MELDPWVLLKNTVSHSVISADKNFLAVSKRVTEGSILENQSFKLFGRNTMESAFLRDIAEERRNWTRGFFSKLGVSAMSVSQRIIAPRRHAGADIAPTNTCLAVARSNFMQMNQMDRWCTQKNIQMRKRGISNKRKML